MEWITSPNDIIKFGDFVKDSFNGKIYKLISTRDAGRERLSIVSDLYNGKTQEIPENRLMKTQNSQWLKKEESKWLEEKEETGLKFEDRIRSLKKSGLRFRIAFETYKKNNGEIDFKIFANVWNNL